MDWVNEHLANLQREWDAWSPTDADESGGGGAGHTRGVPCEDPRSEFGVRSDDENAAEADVEADPTSPTRPRREKKGKGRRARRSDGG